MSPARAEDDNEGDAEEDEGGGASSMEKEAQWLRQQGWHLKPQALLSILNQPSEGDLSSSSSCITQAHARNDIIGQLLDSDLKDVGSPSLPDTAALQRVSRLQGPLVLQVVSMRNISQSSSKSLLRSGNDQHGRLLRICLTDGCTIVSAIEYHSMPAFSLDVAPGTKVKLENIVPVQNGFLLGDARSFTILGGVVPALYESWEMERKYSGLARMTGTKSARVEGDSGGPPPFHGLHVPRAGKFDQDKKPSVMQQSQQQGVHSGARSLQEKEVMISSSVIGKEHKGSGHQGIAETSNSSMSESLTSSRTATSGASSSHQAESKRQLQDEDVPVGRSKDLDVRKDAIKAVLALGVETAPLQNRAAAQKLLEKRTDFHSSKEHGRGRGGRGRGRRGERQQEESTLTLDEWEAKRGVSNWSNNRVANDATTCDDEALAQRLHYQLNVESKGHESTGEAEQIRLSMFSFAGDREVNDDSGRGRHGGRGRGRGRGRRRGR